MHDIEFDLSISLNVKLNDIHVIRLSIYIFLIKYNSDNHYAYLAIVCLLQPLEKSIIIRSKFRPTSTSAYTKDHKNVTSKIACPKKGTRNLDFFPYSGPLVGTFVLQLFAFQGNAQTGASVAAALYSLEL